MDPLFPELPEDLTELSDDDLANLLQEHEVAAELIDAEDEDFIKGMEADEVLSAYEAGVEQIEKIREEQQRRMDAEAAYREQKAALSERRKSLADASDDADADEADAEELDEEDDAELSEEDDAEEAEAEEVEEEQEEEPVAVVASAKKPALRRPPAPSKERQLHGENGAVLVAAAGLQDVRGGQPLDRMGLAKVMRTTAIRRGSPTKHHNGVEEKIRIASANFEFPDDRRLDPSDWEKNSEMIRKVIPADIPGIFGLVASGGLCAPLTPIYSMPNFAVADRPVRDSLPSFQADRGGVNVPAATYIADITSAITVIEESDDALGGTFATKSCQDLDCPAYSEVPVTIVSHCREYGNLNARAWPEKIAHENDLTMAAHARSAENYLLDRIKALSINVTQAAVGTQMNAFGSLVHAITKMSAGIRFRLRMNRNARFRVLMPAWVPDLLAADNALMNFDRYQAQNQLASALQQYGIAIGWYLDDVTGGTSQGFAAETAGAIDDFPDDVQYALFAEGSFIHVDGGSLELGIVRDSTLNSTNDYQIFGESFENVARLGPAQGALWVTQDVCPNGVFPALGTALTC